MTEYIFYHNPRCSKSRQALALIEEQSITPTIIHYLETPPDHKTLKEILSKLGISARQLLRTSEDEYKELGLVDDSLTETKLIDAMVKHPKLIERPILVVDNKAVIGRPPENVLALIK
ncbi:arsenate reductase (glutaredoxin) [Entomomonas asaccharolytica]|uniref:Arsenate reductase n=1 Tax=Entomomonas asaccharolytica TaxID=2785331 RepID=A0A974NF66_9GAMM|nr:arsenate reductase (glutaredoxin) [Entomomonas asaccharolytica]QQP85389.1 arsenate reductase (glutaredoxin) [Entomomonas asaccharolytica]